MHDQSDDSQALLARLNAGDRAAGDELFTRIYPRLVQLARLMLGSYYNLPGGNHAESLVHMAWIDLQTALRRVRPESPACYVSLAAYKVRLALLDLARKERRRLDTVPLGPSPADVDGSSPSYEPQTGSSCDPGRLEIWSQFHEAVGELPDELREVFELYFYADEKPNQARVAELVDKPHRTVARLIAKARVLLTKRVSGLRELLA